MNYDFRYEYLIGRGQNINVSAFFKDFKIYRDWETDRKSTRLNSSH